MPVPPLFTIVKGITGTIDHWLEMRYAAPSCMVTFYGVTECGKPREQGLSTINPNIITPETESTTHYFWGSCRDFDIDSPQMSEKFRLGAQHAFEHEDRPVLEAQQLVLGERDLMTLKPVLLRNDAGSAHARRIVERLLASEQTAR
jgi:vanillate O-demethylase monooxygenase subunit